MYSSLTGAAATGLSTGAATASTASTQGAMEAQFAQLNQQNMQFQMVMNELNFQKTAIQGAAWH